MANPILVELTRGAIVESRHRGAVAVVDADGATVLAIGDVATPVFPRSAVKPMQALALVESGAADRFGFGATELALACASHNGEAGHVAVAERMLRAAGRDEATLACGAAWPFSPHVARELARAGGFASPLHHNCSGKHAGFICAACALGVDPAGYVEPGHPVQRAVKSILEDLSKAAIPDARRGTDGCSVPNWAMPLDRLALAFARYATGHRLSPERANAAARLRAAIAAKPWYVAGTGRFCTEIMTHFGARVLVKLGAEGVHAGALPDQGLGIAVKCDDGHRRAAELMMAATIARYLPLDDADREFLDKYLRSDLRNLRHTVVGEIRATGDLM